MKIDCQNPSFYRVFRQLCNSIDESPRDKTNKMICAPSKDSAQPGHLDAQVDLRLCCSHIA